MGKESNIICGYLKDNQRFADLYNGSFFQGRQVIRAEALREASEVYTGKNKNSPTTYQRIRDVKKLLDNGVMLRILAIESQTIVDYTMPWRCLDYDNLEYGTQIQRIKTKNQKEGVYDSVAERFCGIKKSDRLIPAYTICLYHGEEPWDAPRCLKDMMDFGCDREIWEQWFVDYPMNLICINEQKDFTCFHSPLRELFSVLRYRKDKKELKKLLQEDPQYQAMDEETAQVVGALMGVDKFMQERDKYRKEDKYNMCQALQEMMEESKEEGREEGREEVIKALVEAYGDLGLSREEVAERLIQKCSVPLEKADSYIRLLPNN